jgi:hypothetical protein
MPKELPADTRVTHWADLRPSHTYLTSSEWLADNGALCEVAAVVVTEFVPTTSSAPEPKTLYEYKCLDANAAEISDWVFDDLDDALAMLERDAPGAEWEHLATGDSLRLVRERLGRPPS